MGILTRVSIAALALLCLLPSGRAGEPTPAIVPAEWQSLHDRWAAALAEFKIPGMAVAVVKDDKIVLLDAFGIRDPGTLAPVAIDSPFYIASSTKSFTAMAVSMLVDEGKLQLDDPVRRSLPRAELADPAVSESMTIRDLLAHRLGIDSGPIATCEAYTGLIDDERYYRLLKRVKPTKRFRYSNLNFTLAGRAIRAASGQTWQQFIAERIFKPAGMTHSYCLASRLYADPLAALPIVETDGKWQVARTQKTDATMHAAGGMGCSAADLGRWLRLNLNLGTIDGKRLLSEALAREMQSSQIRTEPGQEGSERYSVDGYGLGWFLGNYREHSTVHHFGGYTGARCHVSFMPRERIGVAVVINSSGPGTGLLDVVASEAYDKLLNLPSEDYLADFRKQVERARAQVSRRPSIEEQPPTSSEGLSRPIEAYVGDFCHEDYGTLHIAQVDGALSFNLGAHRPLVTRTTQDSLMANIVPGSRCKCEFEISPEGRVTSLLVRDFFGPIRFARP